MPFFNNALAGKFKNLLHGARDFALDKLNVPRPESLFIKALTGGGQVQTEMTPLELSKIKGAYEYKKSFKPPNEEEILKDLKKEKEFQDSMAPILNPTKTETEISKLKAKLSEGTNSFKGKSLPEKAAIITNNILAAQRSPVVSLYDSGRDMTMAYGNLSVIPQDDGSVQILDKFKVDSNLFGKDSFDKVGDLSEGGPGAAMAYNLARRLGTWRDIDINVNVPKEEWRQMTSIKPDVRGMAAPFEGTEEEWNKLMENKKAQKQAQAGDFLNQFNHAYMGLKRMGGVTTTPVNEMEPSGFKP